MWDRKEQVFLNLLGPEDDLDFVAGGAKEAGLARKWYGHTLSALAALVAGDAFTRIAAGHKPIHRVRHDWPEITITVRIEAMV